MKKGGLIALAIIAAAMAAFIVLDARHRGAGSDRAVARERLLPPFDRKTVQSITIRRPGGAFSMRHLPSPAAPAPAPGWRIEQVGIDGAPPADDAAIDDLLAALALAESDRNAEVSPTAAGLQPPATE